jgi:hypothetical protein
LTQSRTISNAPLSGGSLGVILPPLTMEGREGVDCEEALQSSTARRQFFTAFAA